MTCIRKEHIQDLKKDLKDQGFSLASLHKYKTESADRIAYLEKFFNNKKEAEFFNNKYENYLLKKQKSNLKEWAKKATRKGLKSDNTKTLIEKIDSLKKALKPSDKPILNGLVKQKLGFTITPEYAKSVYDAYNNYKNDLATVMKNHPDYMKMSGDDANNLLTEQIKAGKGDLYDLALSLVKLKAAYQDAKLAADKKEKSKTWGGRNLMRVEKFAGALKSLKASLDISVPRQLSAAFATGGKISKAAWEGYKFGLKTAGQAFKQNPQFAQDLVDMYILTRPNALNGMYRKLGVDVGLKEEAFPETMVGKLLNKTVVFPASEIAFTGAIQMSRANIADVFIEQYNGDLGGMKDDGVGDYINQITGRGKVHIKWNGDTQSLINVLFFAPKWLAARIRTITDLQYVVTGKTQVEKMRAKTALNNVLLFVLLPMLLKGASRAFDPDDPHGDDAFERFLSAFDPRSSEFGKGRIGNTRIDFTFGMAGIYTAVARGIAQSTISTKGVKKDTSWADVLGSFYEGKLSPAMRTISDIQSAWWGDGKGFGGKNITFWGEVGGAVIPITLQNVGDIITAARNDGVMSTTAISATVGVITDFFGVGANTYEPSEKDIGKSKEFMLEEERLGWNINRVPSDIRPASTSSIMTKLDGKRQEKAVEEFKKLYNDEVTKLIKSSAYKKLSDDGKKEALKNVRNEVNKAIKKKYNLK